MIRKDQFQLGNKVGHGDAGFVRRCSCDVAGDQCVAKVCMRARACLANRMCSCIYVIRYAHRLPCASPKFSVCISARASMRVSQALLMDSHEFSMFDADTQRCNTVRVTGPGIVHPSCTNRPSKFDLQSSVCVLFSCVSLCRKCVSYLYM